MLQEGNNSEIFISHSSLDAELVGLFSRLLTNIFRIQSSLIYCTSNRTNQRPEAGEDYINDIKENIRNAKIVFFIITEDYLKSIFCTMEMGAAWALKSNIVPIIVPPLIKDCLNKTPLKTIGSIGINEWEEIYKKLSKISLVDDINFSQSASLRDGAEDYIKGIKTLLETDDRMDYVRYEAYTCGFNEGEAVYKHQIIKDAINCVHLEINFNNLIQKELDAFISFVGEFFPYRDWSQKTIKDNFYFEVCSPDGDITSLCFELKCTSAKKIIHSEKRTISREWQPVSIPLERIRDNWIMYLTQVCEICFVVRPEDTKLKKGNIYLRNICLSDYVHQF